ncbi:MAG: hypothetical protein AB7O38_12570 [Pirellulaceae bacterium]
MADAGSWLFDPTIRNYYWIAADHGGSVGEEFFLPDWPRLRKEVQGAIRFSQRLTRLKDCLSPMLGTDDACWHVSELLCRAVVAIHAGVCTLDETIERLATAIWETVSGDGQQLEFLTPIGGAGVLQEVLVLNDECRLEPASVGTIKYLNAVQVSRGLTGQWKELHALTPGQPILKVKYRLSSPTYWPSNLRTAHAIQQILVSLALSIHSRAHAEMTVATPWSLCIGGESFSTLEGIAIHRAMSREQIERIKFSWSLLESANCDGLMNGTSRLARALCRLQTGLGRETHEALVDLTIVLETLLGTGNKDELKFRYSLMTSHLLGTSPDERREFFQTVKRAYDARSDLVHGGNSRDRANLDELLNRFRRVVSDVVLLSLQWRGTAGSKEFAKSIEESMIGGTPHELSRIVQLIRDLGS